MFKRKLGFTLLEVSVILLVASVALAAMTPVMTKKMRTQGTLSDCAWKTSGDNAIVPSGTLSNVTVGVWGNEDSSKLTLRSGEGAPSNLVRFYDEGGTDVLLSLGKTDDKVDINLSSEEDSISGFSADYVTLNKGDGFKLYNGENTDNPVTIDATSNSATLLTGGGFGYKQGIDTISLGATTINNFTRGLVIATDNLEAGSIEDSVYISNHVGNSDNLTLNNSVLLGGPFGALTNASNSILIGSTLNTVTSATDSIVIAAKTPSANSFNNETVFSANNMYIGDFQGNINSGAIFETSDANLKDIVGDYRYGLSSVLQLYPYNFTYKNDKTKTPHVGIIAQDLLAVIPEAVFMHNDKKLYIKSDYVFYALVNAVKELDDFVTTISKEVQSKINFIAKKLDEQDAKLAKAQDKIQKQQEKIDKLKIDVNNYQAKLDARKAL